MDAVCARRLGGRCWSQLQTSKAATPGAACRKAPLAACRACATGCSRASNRAQRASLSAFAACSESSHASARTLPLSRGLSLQRALSLSKRSGVVPPPAEASSAAAANAAARRAARRSTAPVRAGSRSAADHRACGPTSGGATEAKDASAACAPDARGDIECNSDELQPGLPSESIAAVASRYLDRCHAVQVAETGMDTLSLAGQQLPVLADRAAKRRRLD